MGCLTSKTTNELLRSHSALVKAHFTKKAQLEQDLNSLNIRQNYSKFNPSKRTFKQLKTKRKEMNTTLSNARLRTRALSNHPAKVHGSIPVLDSELICDFKQESQNLCELLEMTVDQEEGQLDLKISQLICLKNTLARKKRSFDKNKRKIEQAAIVKDLCEGKQRACQFIQTFDGKALNSKQALRVDSISTAASDSFLHVKNSHSMKIEDLNLEEVEISKLDLSMQIPKNSTNRQCLKKCFKLSENALLLRAKLLLKHDLEKVLNKNKKILKKKMKKARFEIQRLEKLEEVIETDPQVYLERLTNEVFVREQDLGSALCQREYFQTLISFGKNEESLSESPDELLTESLQIIIET